MLLSLLVLPLVGRLAAAAPPAAADVGAKMKLEMAMIAEKKDELLCDSEADSRYTMCQEPTEYPTEIVGRIIERIAREGKAGKMKLFGLETEKLTDAGAVALAKQDETAAETKARTHSASLISFPSPPAATSHADIDVQPRRNGFDDPPTFSRERRICDTLADYVFPKRALNKGNKFRFIVNMPDKDFIQAVRIEKCRAPSSECKLDSGGLQLSDFDIRTECRQTYGYQRLLAITEEGTEVMDQFKIPTSCVCYRI